MLICPASCALLPTESAKEVAKVEKAVLSTTAKAKERQKKKDAEKQSKSGAAGTTGHCGLGSATGLATELLSCSWTSLAGLVWLAAHSSDWVRHSKLH